MSAPPGRRTKRLAPLALLALLATSCGSTVQVSSAPQGGAAGLGGPAPQGPAATSGSVTSAPGGQTQSSSGATTTSAAAGSLSGTSTLPQALATSLADGTLASGPGVTAHAVYIGLIYDVNAGAVNQAAGIGSITTGDTKANTKAVIADINKHGGVGGRTLVPVYAKFDSTSTQTLDQQYAAICSQFTQDSPRVFAAEGVGVDSYRKCLTKAGVTILSTDLPVLGAADFQQYPTLIEQGYANLDRLAAYEVSALVKANYFTPWDTLNNAPAATGTPKVGIYTYDDIPFRHAVDTFLVPALKRLGYNPMVAYIAQVNTASDYGQQAAAVKSAQLSFAANGVTHVISFEGNGGLSLFFLTNAKSQSYYPRYGINSASGFQALVDTGAIKSDQVHGAVGFGWLPMLDLHSQLDPDNGPYSNDPRRRCVKVMNAAGITFSSSNAEAVAMENCSDLWLLKAVLDKTPGQITPATFLHVVEGLGTAYQAAGGLGESFAPGRHDPADKAYLMQYYSDCDCFHYFGPLQTIP